MAGGGSNLWSMAGTGLGSGSEAGSDVIAGSRVEDIPLVPGLSGANWQLTDSN